MDKRLLLAIALSILVVIAWMAFFAPHPVPVAPEAGTKPPAPEANVTASGDTVAVGAPSEPETAPALDELADSEERTESLIFGEPGEPGFFRATFSNRGARLVRLELGDYYKELHDGDASEASKDWSTSLVLAEPFVTAQGESGSLLLSTSPSSEPLAPRGLDQVLWHMEIERAPSAVRFTYAPGTGVVFTKRIAAVPGTWRLDLELGIENKTSELAGLKNFTLIPVGGVPAELGDSFYPEPRAVAAGVDPKDGEPELDWKAAPRASGEGEAFDLGGPLLFAGSHSKYFAFLLRPASDTASSSMLSARWRPLVPADPRRAEDPKSISIETDVQLELRVPAQGSSALYAYTVYAGPKGAAALIGDLAEHELLIDSDLSTFSSIGHFLLAVLRFFHRITGNWGVAIILLTICVRLALFPINRRSQTAMARYGKKMKRVQPRLEEVKKKYANDSAKLREAQGRIMQEEGAFPPLGGCLPVFLQIPVFFGLFSALRTTFDLRQAPFALWMDDLSRPDQLLRLDWEIPLVFTTFDLTWLNLLPILMVVLWILQQRGMPTPADEQAARMQKMMAWMPVLFGFMLYNYAAGLSLYMITQSGLGIVEQKVIKKLWPIDDTEPEKKGSGCGPFSGAMQHLAKKHQEQMKAVQAVQRERQKNQKKRR